MYKKFLLGSTIVLGATTVAVSTTTLLEVAHLSDVIKEHGHTISALGDRDITRAEAGSPQTIMILGSDHRKQDQPGDRPHSDTILLLRLDPDQPATTVMSIPRDLKVPIPGHGVSKINQAYFDGGPKLALQTVKQLLSTPGHPFVVNHVVDINFRGFRRAVDYVGCVYVDVDRRYFNPVGTGYASIDIQPGYQRLCGQDALDYVRYRHFDSDLVRAARQQDFLRQAKDQIGVSRIFGDRHALLKIFGKYTQTDIRGTPAILRLLKLVAQSANHPVQEIHFPGDAGPTYVTTTPERLKKAVHDFLNAKGSSGPRGKATPTKPTRRHKRSGSGVPAGLVANKTVGEDQAATIATKVGFPVYYPKLMPARGNYRSNDNRAYNIYDRGHHKYRAYRIVGYAGDIGQYYGVEGTTWTSPPLLDNPSETRTLNGRKFELFFDGSRLRLVAYRTKRGVYWVSNTLLQTLTNQQMLALAESLTRIGH